MSDVCCIKCEGKNGDLTFYGGIKVYKMYCALCGVHFDFETRKEITDIPANQKLSLASKGKHTGSVKCKCGWVNNTSIIIKECPECGWVPYDECREFKPVWGTTLRWIPEWMFKYTDKWKKVRKPR